MRWVVDATLDRETIFLAQTPQAFRRSVLRDALALRPAEATDESSLAEKAGHTVRIVEGEASNIKITTPDDVPMAEAIASGGQAGADRSSGDGLRPAPAGRRTARSILGGVTIPFELAACSAIQTPTRSATR